MSFQDSGLIDIVSPSPSGEVRIAMPKPGEAFGDAIQLCWGWG